jgi:hypothetical protein
MKTSTELIQELDSMTKRFGHALLVIGFAKKNRVVGMEFPKVRLQRLEECLSKGGVPIAVVGRQQIRGVPRFYSRLFDEVAQEVWAELFMITFIDRLYHSDPGVMPTDLGISVFQRLLRRGKAQKRYAFGVRKGGKHVESRHT